MKTVYKYELKVQDISQIEMPKNAEILSVQVQNEKAYLWVLVETSESNDTRYFRLVGTGHEIEKEIANVLKFVGTFQLCDGSFVGHLFEVLTLKRSIAEAVKFL